VEVRRTCRKCGLEKELEEFKTKRSCPSGKENTCKECDNIRKRFWELIHPEKVAEARKRFKHSEKGKLAAKKWESSKKGKALRLKMLKKYWASEKGKAVGRRSCKKYKHTEAGRKTQQKYWGSIKGKAVLKRYATSAKGKINSYVVMNKRRAVKKKAAPKWADKNIIKELYTRAKLLGLEVDHIVPLNSPIVCGLHTPDNLELVSRIENRKKGNRVWPDMP
jgi:hypothetical protein